MPWPDERAIRAGKRWGAEIYTGATPAKTAELDIPETKDIMLAVDAFFDTLAGSHDSGTTIRNLLNAAVDASIRNGNTPTVVTNNEKAITLKWWALEETNQIPE